ncbi:4a-hydroxytetrahydrobiopterin dehydratase [Patescibacteria group bacterium]|nr:4a-hydroxytetrahydrobiopterin dehydratase [Patescibacteria group bacterium]
MDTLLEKKCIPCEGGTAALTKTQAEEYLSQVNGWNIDTTATCLSKKYSFPDFKSALQFANQIGEVAESEGHHPDLTVSWGKVEVDLTTHAIHGLSENDFILAAKVDALTRK